MVPRDGLEPSRFAAADFESAVSTIPPPGLCFGRCSKIRTCDPLHPMQVRYQAAPYTVEKYNKQSDIPKACGRNQCAVVGLTPTQLSI